MLRILALSVLAVIAACSSGSSSSASPNTQPRAVNLAGTWESGRVTLLDGTPDLLEALPDLVVLASDRVLAARFYGQIRNVDPSSVVENVVRNGTVLYIEIVQSTIQGITVTSTLRADAALSATSDDVLVATLRITASALGESRSASARIAYWRSGEGSAPQ